MKNGNQEEAHAYLSLHRENREFLWRNLDPTFCCGINGPWHYLTKIQVRRVENESAIAKVKSVLTQCVGF